MVVCNTFKTLSKNTGSFLTFGQYVEDLTAWKTLSKDYNIVPSKFIAIDCQANGYDNLTFPRTLQELFENGCACFKNKPGFEWKPKYAKTIFWDTMFEMGVLKESSIKDESGSSKISSIKGVKYVGDINIQSYNEVDGMGYSEIYCHIPNEAPSYNYTFYRKNFDNDKIETLTKNQGDLLEGFELGELNGSEQLSMVFKEGKSDYEYQLGHDFVFSWEEDSMIYSTQTQEDQFNINMIVILYDVWSEQDETLYKNIPLGLYITGLFDNGVINNPITKYVSNEDIYNSGTSYGLRICSRFVVATQEDNYIVKEITCEDNNHGDLSRVLSQLAISQNKMDDILNKKYVTDQNYKNLLSIFKNSKTNVPYIKQVNDNEYWFVNGKMLGPSSTENLFAAYTNLEIKNLIENGITQIFQILTNVIGAKLIASDYDVEGEKGLMDTEHLLIENPENNGKVTINLNWNLKYDGVDVNASKLTINDKNYTNSAYLEDTILLNTLPDKKTKKYYFEAEHNKWITRKKLTISVVNPIYFGELDIADGSSDTDIIEHIKKIISDIRTGNVTEHTEKLQKVLKLNPNGSCEMSTNENTNRICYIYPKSFGQLKSISDNYNRKYNTQTGVSTDPGFEDFKEYELKIPINGIPVYYYAYVVKADIYVDKYILNFEVKNPQEDQTTQEDQNDQTTPLNK